jgi:bacterial/archaeal transporter family-2 protein
MQWLLVVLAMVTGVLNTIQTGNNTTLNKALGQPYWSLVTVFAVALCTSLVIALASGQRPPQGSALAQVPWWGFIGGIFGAVYILSMLLMAEKLGAAVFMGLTVTAATITSLVMDHFGLLGFQVHEAGLGRIAGGLLMMAGLGLIAAF